MLSKSASFSLLLLSCTYFFACGGTQPCPESELVSNESHETQNLEHRLLHAVAWTQNSAEFSAMTTQLFRGAILPMEDALADPTWTAVLEQTANYEALPPAIVLDLDETVLDNSPYQAWLLLNGETFNHDSWNAWCQSAEATAIPGVLSFLATMEDMGITPIFLSNRDVQTETATVRNLISLGIDTSPDMVWLRDEIDEGSAKSGRRIAIAQNYRIIGLFGDNLGDFTDDYHGSVEERAEVVNSYHTYWGERWFVLPNPQYGSWVPAIAPYNLSTEESASALRNSLRVWNNENF